MNPCFFNCWKIICTIRGCCVENPGWCFWRMQCMVYTPKWKQWAVTFDFHTPPDKVLKTSSMGRVGFVNESAPRKFKEGIYCGGHFAITYGVIMPLDFFIAKPAKQAWLLIRHIYLGDCGVNHAVMKIASNDRAKSEGTKTWLHVWWSIWTLPHSIKKGSKERPDSLLNSFISTGILNSGILKQNWACQPLIFGLGQITPLVFQPFCSTW